MYINDLTKQNNGKFFLQKQSIKNISNDENWCYLYGWYLFNSYRSRSLFPSRWCRQWLYEKVLPKSPQNFVPPPSYKIQKNIPSYQKKRQQKVQKSIEKELKLKINDLESKIIQLQAQKQTINQDYINYQNLTNNSMNQLKQRVNEKEKWITFIHEEKKRIQIQNNGLKQNISKVMIENKGLKQNINELLIEKQKQKTTYQGLINNLSKNIQQLKSIKLQIKTKQVTDVEIQKRLVQKEKQLITKIEKEFNIQKDLLLKQITTLKDSIDEKQEKYNNQRISHQQVINILSQQLRQQRETKENIKEQLQQQIHRKLNEQFEKVRQEHLREVIKLRNVNQKLVSSLNQQKEMRSKQVNRVKTLLTAKHQKQIKTLEENYRLKQKLWIIQSKQILTQRQPFLEKELVDIELIQEHKQIQLKENNTIQQKQETKNKQKLIQGLSHEPPQNKDQLNKKQIVYPQLQPLLKQNQMFYQQTNLHNSNQPLSQVYNSNRVQILSHNVSLCLDIINMFLVIIFVLFICSILPNVINQNSF